MQQGMQQRSQAAAAATNAYADANLEQYDLTSESNFTYNSGAHDSSAMDTETSA